MIKLLIFIVVIAIPAKVFSAQTWQIVTENYPPYFSENLPNNGWLYEVAESALKTQGINSEVEFTTWARALKLLEKNRKTAILGAFYSLKRNARFFTTLVHLLLLTPEFLNEKRVLLISMAPLNH